MTREEAIERNKNLRMYMKLTDKNQPCKFLEENYIALDLAIKALEHPEKNVIAIVPCGDAISRQSAIDALTGWETEPLDEDIERTLKLLPSVNPQEPKTGHWISDAIQGEIDGQIVKAFICSKCGAISVFRMTDGKIINGDLCPNCGAKMQEEEE